MKKFIIILLSILVYFHFPSTSQSALVFKDIPENYWASEEIDFLVSKNIISGYNDGTFKPNSELTRIQIALLIQRVKNYSTENRHDPNLIDIPRGSKYYMLVSTLVDEGLFDDFSLQGEFLPSEFVTRAEMASILTRAFHLTGTSSKLFSDVEYDDWWFEYVDKMIANKITMGTSDELFSPNQNVTRVQFSAFLARILDDRFIPNIEVETSLIDDTINTPSEIRQKWEESKPTISSDPFLEKPILTSPFSPGKLTSAELENGIKMTNFVRFLVGFPDIKGDDDLHELSQYGAVVTAANGHLSHYPTKPDSMQEDFFQKGYTSASQSNLHMIGRDSPRFFSKEQGFNYGSFLSYSVASYMSDPGLTNLASVGHRRWILSPRLSKIGFGLATDEKFYYTPMHVLDRSTNLDWEYTTWPAKGYFPYQFLQKKDAWSVQLNPDKFSIPQIEKINVVVRRLDDNKTWSLSNKDTQVSFDEDYFNVDTKTYGYSYAIIFRPSEIVTFKGSTFEITIKGLKKLYGETADIQFRTHFFDLTM